MVDLFTMEDLFTLYEYYLLARNPKRSLYEELISTDKFKDEEPNKIIFEFYKFIECFNKIFQMESKLVFSFWYLPNQVFWKTILTTAKDVGFSDFGGLCKELRKVYYSYWMAGYTTSKIKQLSFNLIGWVKEKKQLTEIRKETEMKMTEDNVIKLMTENLQNDVYGEPWLKPLLALIEYEQTDDSKISFIELNNKLHVDHILPAKWYLIDDWKKKWTKNQADKWLHKIGNLTLLSGKKNIAASNDSFKKKKDIYEKGHGGTTAFEISKQIIGKLDWLENDVEKRQKWMTGQIETILGLNLE